MTSKRRDRDKRRNLNPQEMHDLGYADLKSNADEDGWPYPDDDDEQTTEDYLNAGGRRRKQPRTGRE